MRSRLRITATAVVIVATVVGGGCKSKSQEGSAGAQPNPSASVATPVSSTTQPVMVSRDPDGAVLMAYPTIRVEDDAGPIAPGLPVPASKVEAAVNPGHFVPYSGATGVVEGTVTVSGDAPPKLGLPMPFACREASATYDKVFREGNGRTLADVMIAVTGYNGYVPAQGEVSAVKIHGCAFDRRTIVMTYGQHIEVSNTDLVAFLPTLNGANMPAQLVAIPRGDAVKLYPMDVGHYALVDGLDKGWMYADVFVLRYATHAVTGLDGHFRIAGIPVGKVKVSAYLPLIDAQLHPHRGIAQPSLDHDVEVKADKTTKVDFVIPFKAPKPALKTAPASTGAVVR
jgi:hypothetical protein